MFLFSSLSARNITRESVVRMSLLELAQSLDRMCDQYAAMKQWSESDDANVPGIMQWHRDTISDAKFDCQRAAMYIMEEMRLRFEADDAQPMVFNTLTGSHDQSKRFSLSLCLN